MRLPGTLPLYSYFHFYDLLARLLLPMAVCTVTSQFCLLIQW